MWLVQLTSVAYIFFSFCFFLFFFPADSVILLPPASTRCLFFLLVRSEVVFFVSVWVVRCAFLWVELFE